MNYGIEGVNYTLENGVAKKIAGNEIWGHLYFTNELITYPSEGQPLNKKEAYEKFNASLKPSIALGFHYNPEGVKEKAEKVLSISYDYALLSEGYYPGMNDSVTIKQAYEELRQKLKDAGIDEVIEDVQRQFDAWKAAQGTGE